VEGYTSLAVPFASVVEFNPLTGAIADAATDGSQVYVCLKSGQSVILQTFDTPASADRAVQPVQEMATLRLDGQWRLSFTDDSYPQMTGKSYELDGPKTWENLDAETARLMGTGVYETTFTVTPQQFQTATGGFRLDLGDVRESARVWVNGEYIGCAWSVPYVLDCQGLVREGDNTLKIEVTNLPANRIRQMDIDGIVWRIFEDTNINNISNSTDYTKWALMPSGLNSSVKLVMLAAREKAMTAQLTEMRQNGSGDYEPVYQLTTLNGQPIVAVSATDADSQPFTALTTTIDADGMAEVTVTGMAPANITLKATDAGGADYYAYLPANGSYQKAIDIDFTADQEPLGGWQKLASTSAIKGFEGTGKLEWYRSKANGKAVTLYDGVTFSSTASNYYFYFLGYGMNANNDFQAEIAATEGTIMQHTYLVGSNTGSAVYDVANIQSRFYMGDTDHTSLVIDMPANKSYFIHRSLAAYEPKNAVSAIHPVVNRLPQTDTHVYYNLQGQRVTNLSKGVFIKNKKKVMVK